MHGHTEKIMIVITILFMKSSDHFNVFQDAEYTC